MGMIKCAKHGLQFIIPCSKVSAGAVDEGRYQHANVMIDKWGQAALLSDHDRDFVRSETAATQQWGWPDLDFDPPLTACCGLDVDEWLTKTGQGTLSDSLDRAATSRPR